MISASPLIRASVDASTLKLLASDHGPCLTFLLPGQHPGAPTGSHALVMRQLVRSARQKLDSPLLDAVESLANDPEMQSGGPGFVIFRSEKIFQCVRAQGLEQTGFSVGTHFHLAPILPYAHCLKEFYLLSINRKQMRLYRYSNHSCVEIDWPTGIPSVFEETEHLESSITQNRTSTGTSPNSTWSLQFGSPGRPKREGADAHFHHFFAAIDHGIAPYLHGLPLVLSGVSEEVLEYRKDSRYPRILNEPILGNHEHATLAELSSLCAGIAEREYFARGAAALTELRAAKGPTAAGPQAVLKAALSGRVHKLFVRQDAAADDMIDSAIAETLRTGGEVFLLRAAEMPEESLAALLRF